MGERILKENYQPVEKIILKDRDICYRYSVSIRWVKDNRATLRHAEVLFNGLPMKPRSYHVASLDKLFNSVADSSLKTKISKSSSYNSKPKIRVKKELKL